MEENDDLPVSHDHTLSSLFYHPPFGSAVLSGVVAVVSDDRMDEAQELPHYGYERPHFQHASVDETFIVLLHDPVLSDHLDSGRLVMREYYCPACAVMFEIDVVHKDEPPIHSIEIKAT